MDHDSLIGLYTDIGGRSTHVVLDTASGVVKVFPDSAMSGFTDTDLSASLQSEYLVGDRSDFRFATVNGELFICNVAVALQATGAFGGGHDPSRSGFAYVAAGAFARKYTMTLKTSNGEVTVDYTTPLGTGANDAELASPEHIASMLEDAVGALSMPEYVVHRSGAFLFVRYDGVTDSALSITTETGGAYMVTSRTGYVSQVGHLPTRLPPLGDRYICAVGDIDLPQYYQYDQNDDTWRECPKYGSPTAITGGPISIRFGNYGFELDETNLEGRLAGDDESNPLPEFVRTRITGMSTLQGRLVLLAGPRVCMSASKNPRRFMRTTVTSVLDSDPIEVGSSMNTAAAYRHAIPFQKDLILFSEAYQALVPTGNTAITPRNATVVPTSNHACDVSAPPVGIGRTLLFPAPKSADFFGVMEMTPSPYTDSQYVAYDSTAHLPKYLAGRCRFSASCNAGNLAVFGMSGDTHSIAIHEYAWDGDKKVQQAWHLWTFAYPVAYAYFAGPRLYLLFARNGVLLMVNLEVYAGDVRQSSDIVAFLDMAIAVDAVAGRVTIPPALLEFDPDITSKLVLCERNGPAAGEPVGFSVVGNELHTVRSYQDGGLYLGVPYRSSVVLTPPIIRDWREAVVYGAKATLLRLMISTRNSAEFKARVADLQYDPTELRVGTIPWASGELVLGQALRTAISNNIIPCRTRVDSTMVELSTEGTGELNIVGVTPVIKYHQKIRR